MEGVGARQGRSSSRYGPPTVFSGPVRKWKKRWIHVSPSNINNNNHSNQNHHHHHHNNNNVVNGSTVNGNNGSHLLLYKWTPLIQKDGSNNNSNGNVNSNGEKSSAKDDMTPEEEPPRRKFKYIPIAVLEEQKKASEIEAAENPNNEAKPADTEANTAEPTHRTCGFDEKPDINDVPMEENQDNGQIVRQDLNESTLDLSLGLKAHKGDSNSKTNQTRDGKLERLNSNR
ncbi:hypothetical protein Ddye_012873 [Dipteronia dyeriana]|uniref:Uncharacterized protein n=1 Tax=Dipteronia dyeriana TaxID=168575 RepID=A0AAD9X5D7_9ROSI|nr:hypothetical protein Ddye_012873 [Dipteronia dyeriana]